MPLPSNSLSHFLHLSQQSYCVDRYRTLHQRSQALAEPGDFYQVMGAPSFKDSGRYTEVHKSPNGPGDGRPTSAQIIQDNDLIDKWQGKVALITGGSNGLGVDEVKALAKTGATVFFTSRDQAKGDRVKDEILKELYEEGVKDAMIEVVKMELKSLESVRKGAEDFQSRSDKLNVLVNNAGEPKSRFSTFRMLSCSLYQVLQ